MKKNKFLIIGFTVVFSFSMLTGCKSAKVNANNTPNTSTVTDKTKDEKKEVKNYKVEGVDINDKEVSFVDARGKKVTIKKNPQKVVCLYNSLLELWDIAGGKVIGKVDEASEKPVESAKDAVSVGSPGAPSLEKVLSLKPDLVILSNSFKAQAAMADKLEENNIQVICLDNEFFKDYARTMKVFTSVTSKEDLYEKNVVEVRKKIDSLTEKVTEQKKPTVLILFATYKNISAKTEKSMVGEMLKDLKTENVADEAFAADKTLSMEKILQKDPDFIFIQTMGSDMNKVKDKISKDLESNPAWASLKAVKNKKCIYLPKDLYLYRPNNRYYEAYENLAKIIYPGTFK